MEAIEAERVLGLFLNTVPIGLNREPGRQDLVRQARDLEEHMLAHRFYPVVEIYRRLSGQFPRAGMKGGGVRLHELPRIPGTGRAAAGADDGRDSETNFPLTIHARFDAKEGEGRIAVSYRGEWLQRSQAVQVLGCTGARWSACWSSAARGVRRGVAAEREEGAAQQLRQWSRGESQPQLQSQPQSQPPGTLPAVVSRLEHWFTQQAERTPHALAVVSAEERLTHEGAQLPRQPARAVPGEPGCGEEVPVGVCSRSAQMVVSVLAILKASGVYVPLDAGYPAARLSGLIADAAWPCS